MTILRGDFPMLESSFSTDVPGSEESVHGAFAAQALRTPEAIAVEDDTHSLTYRLLEGRANQLARRLLSCGVRPEEPVAVLMTPSIHLPVALLAILKAGCRYLPLH